MKQTAALPWRLGKTRRPEVLLVTGRRSRRWLVPKGWPMVGRSLADAAAQEALEEAGVSGAVEHRPIGSFKHKKRSLFGTINVEVVVHPLAVHRELRDWPERDERERRWFTLEEAAELVQSEELGQLIARLGSRLTVVKRRRGPVTG
jgi:8-oxo-dGTP pyrophosphatase MutT (NUDIX family)